LGLDRRLLPSANTEAESDYTDVASTGTKTLFMQTKAPRCIFGVTLRYSGPKIILPFLNIGRSTQGATDFIFGRRGSAYFGGNTIGVKGAGFVTANGRESDDSGSCVYFQPMNHRA